MSDDFSISKHALELNKNLQKRPTLSQLANNGIYPPLHGPVRYSNERKKLILAQTKDYLQHKFERRPPRTELEKQSILIASERFDPLISQRVPKLKRSFLETNLNGKLKERPGPLELVVGNILKPDDDMLLHLNSEEICDNSKRETPDMEVKVQCNKVLSTKAGKNGMKFYYYDGVLVDKRNNNRPKHSRSGYLGAMEQQLIYLSGRSSKNRNDSGVGFFNDVDYELTDRISYFMDNFTVSELKDLLKQRSCIVSGKKLDLARRLAIFSVNSNSMDCSPAVATDQSDEATERCSQWPSDDCYSSSSVPALSEDCSQWYF